MPPDNEHLAKTPVRLDKGHGRYAMRGFCVLPSSIHEPQTALKWPDLINGSIAQVVVTRQKGATGNKSVEARCFIFSPG